MVFVADLRKHIKFLPVILILIMVLLFFRHYNLSIVDIDQDTAVISINFLVPMDKEDLKSKIAIQSPIPSARFACKIEWDDFNRVIIQVKELDYPKGQKVVLKIQDIKTAVPFVHKSVSIPIQFQAEPKVIEFSHKENVATQGPLEIIFNTPIDEKSLYKHIQSDILFTLKPVKYKNGNAEYMDYSKWALYPQEKLENDTKYLIILRKGLKAQNGLTLGEDVKQQIKTASKPEIIKTVPKQKAQWISIYPNITIEVNEPIKQGIIEVNGEKKNAKVRENILEYLPEHTLEPDTKYTIKVQVQSKYGEKSDPFVFDFKTMPIGEETLWVEVILKERHEVLIHKGHEVIKRMPASGGLPEQPTVKGTFYLGDRGPSFFSKRFGEGATYWVRIVDQYLFHGIPRDKQWNIIEQEFQKIGGPASHGCVRLREEDAKWFYENIPGNTMVIIHE